MVDGRWSMADRLMVESVHMKQVTIFRILTFVLLPIAGVFGLMAMFMLLMTMGNIAILFPLFLLAAFVIYVFASLKFLTRGIDSNQQLKPGLRDWIRVNSFVTIFMSASSLFSLGSLLVMGDSSLREQALLMRNSIPDAPPMLNTELFVRTIKFALWFMGVLGLLTLVHIFLNFRLMKKFGHLFGRLS